MHQEELDKQKGVYHINAVDEVTQCESVYSIEHISEHFLTPALEQRRVSFPCKITAFHSDNGSEYINRQVAELLQELFMNSLSSLLHHAHVSRITRLWTTQSLQIREYDDALRDVNIFTGCRKVFERRHHLCNTRRNRYGEERLRSSRRST